MLENNRNPIGFNRKNIRLSKRTINCSQLRKETEYSHKHKSIFRHKNIIFRQNKGIKSNSYGKRDWLYLLLKLSFITIFILIVIYGIYLDKKIRNRIDGKVWQLPAAVYSRMVNLEPDMSISKDEVIQLLEAMQYRSVKKMTHPGEFIVHPKSIEMIRRAFDFPDKKEGKMRVRLTFDKNCLESIENMDNNRQFGFFRLDPRLITMLSSPTGEQRLFVTRNGFPDFLVDALLATEDRYFYEHDGVSFYSILRAMITNIAAHRTIQGASTLTQQLVKNLFLTRERSYWRKINEAYMAFLMDAHYSKDRILELYMNEVYLGQSGDEEIRGFPLASFYYFGLPIEELSLEQQALLVGMVRGASIYNPWRNPNLALERRNLVLRLIQQHQIIDQNLYNTLNIRPLSVRPRGFLISSYPAFMQMVRKELQEKLGDKIKDLSGAKIFTTFDCVSQGAAEKAAIDGISILRKQCNLRDLETAIVVVDRYSGEVRAMIGGSDPHYAGYNRAMQARRSIGSLAKPTTYLTALSQPDKYRLNTWIADEPLFLRQPNGQIWSPKNDNCRFSGQVMIVDALTRSVNIPTVNLGMSVGLSRITNMWKILGIPKNQLRQVPSIILGALNLTPIEVAQAFQTIASGGSRALLSSLRSVISENGAVLYQSYPQAEQAISPQAAYMTMWTMQQVVQNGTGRQLGMLYPDLHLAGKTGTTNNNIDTWFTGIDNREVVVTWVGRDNNQPTKLYGSNGAMLIYQRYLANQFSIPLNLIPPENIIDMGIDETGNFVCSGWKRRLPVWKRNLDILCYKSQS